MRSEPTAAAIVLTEPAVAIDPVNPRGLGPSIRPVCKNGIRDLQFISGLGKMHL